ncbi:MAG: ABC transporter permease [Alphaproteobacteria bacterium]
MSRNLREKLSPWAVALGLLILWEVAVRVSGVTSEVMPSASQSFIALWEFRGPLWSNALYTLMTTSIGFVIAVAVGIALGIATGVSRPVYIALYPLLVGFNSIPKVAVVPILVIWFGINMWPPILTAFVLAFFPIVVNVAAGLATIEPELRDVLRALGANERDILVKVGLPRSLPFLFASLKVAITLSFVGAVIAETVAGSKGIGHVMLIASSNFNTPLMFAGLIVIAAMAIGMYAVFAITDRHFTGWATRSMDYTGGG